MRVAPFALVTGLLPLLCINLTYLIAASLGHVDWCVPYWDSCTSISATGRQLPEKLVFKLFMLPVGLLIAVFWWITNHWLNASGRRFSMRMFCVGSVAALLLMLYVVALGETGQAYAVVRRIGITLFFSLTYLAQLFFLVRCSDSANALGSALQSRVLLWQRRMAMILLTIGISTVVLDLNYKHYDAIEDAFEWVMMLFIVGQFCSHYWLWKDVDLRISFWSQTHSSRPSKYQTNP